MREKGTTKQTNWKKKLFKRFICAANSFQKQQWISNLTCIIPLTFVQFDFDLYSNTTFHERYRGKCCYRSKRCQFVGMHIPTGSMSIAKRVNCLWKIRKYVVVVFFSFLCWSSEWNTHSHRIMYRVWMLDAAVYSSRFLQSFGYCYIVRTFVSRMEAFLLLI